MFVDGLIPRVTRYTENGSKSFVQFGSRFDMRYASSVCRTWQYSSPRDPITDVSDPGTMQITYSDVARITGTFSAKLRLIEVSFFGDTSEICPNGIDSTRPNLEEITVSGSFDIERPAELLLNRKLDDGRIVQETWQAP